MEPMEPNEPRREQGVSDGNVATTELWDAIGLAGIVGNTGMNVPGATCGGIAM